MIATSISRNALRAFLSGIALLTVVCNAIAADEDWGSYSLVPASAPKLVLEAPTAKAGTTVSIGQPSGTAIQKWQISAKSDGYVSIHPVGNPALALAAANGGKTNSTAIVLENDGNQPWQLWSLRKQDNQTYTLTPKHAPSMGLDHFGGNPTPGARIDLWDNKPGDQHLQWRIEARAGTALFANAPAVAPSAYVPAAIDPASVREGTIKQFKFTQSAVFPGTVRDVTVFIPAQIDPAKPACVYVKTDGYNPREKALMETMIATKEIPVTVGVFVRPGEVPAPMPGTLGRRNRCFEYDSVNDNNLRFLIDELLPYIAKELQLNLSTSGNDRCISGGSSGGIAAFTAAWHRPDAFSRVYAASGSWVAFRGGHEFPTMVRKFEAKPIRSFLTTATRDMENCAGDWFLIDQEMDKALKFSGYDYQFRVIDGPHVAGYMENFREAMAYLWKDWPASVQAGASAPRARDILLPDAKWELLASGVKDARSPAVNARGEVYFAQPAANKIQRIELDGTIKEFASDAGAANGLAVNAEGTLFAVSQKTGKVRRYDAAGSATDMVDGIRGNSILAIPSGGLFVTGDGSKAGESGVWFLKDGKKSLVDVGLKRATGLALRPDHWLLSVADGDSKWAYSYQVAADGTLANKERFFSLHVADWEDDAGAESVCYALEGQMFVATRSGIQVCADDGPTQVILPVPDNSRVLGVCLGGRELDTLFAFCGDKIWKRKVKCHAVGAFSPWTKVIGTKL